MAIPTTAFSAHLLLILSFLLLGLWSSTFKLAGQRWRFELFSFDFAFGNVLFALLASYFLGTLGTDLGMSEQLMLASRTSQAFAFGSGCLFAFGNMLLLAAISLLGLSFAYGIATAAAILVLAAVAFDGFHAVLFGIAIIAAIVALIFQARGANPAPAQKSPDGRKARAKPNISGFKRSTKGIIVSVLGGLALGAVFTPLQAAIFGQFGVGAFAGLVIFSLGALAATLVLSFYFMNIAIEGGGVGLGEYMRGGLGQHLVGIAGGVLCAGGILALLIVSSSFPPDVQPDRIWLAVVPLGAGLVAIVLGLSRWGGRAASGSIDTRSIFIGLVSLMLAIGAFSFAVSRAAPPPAP